MLGVWSVCKSRWRGGLLLAAGLTIGCAPKTSVPIPRFEYPTSATANPVGIRRLVVLLPGRGDSAGEYERHGFVDMLRTSKFASHVIAVDAHYGYYRDRTMPARVHEDIIAPLRQRYDEIWVIGISMGGLGALLVAERYPGDVNGVVLLAPYLGRPKTVARIAEAGGLAGWSAPAQPSWDEKLWAWAQKTPVPLYLGFGTEDFGVRAHRVLADGLAPDHVFTALGSHNWDTWAPLFARILAALPSESDATTGTSAASADPG